MNDNIENCLYKSGLTAQGCWDELDDYAKQGIEKFAELIIKQCCNVVDAQNYYVYSGDVKKLILERFGIEA